MRVAVISPHLDDAVFSVAEHMLSRPDWEFTIVTPFGGQPLDEPHRSKYLILHDEHQRVCEFAGWDFINGTLLDDAARVFPWNSDDTEFLREWLGDAVAGFDQVWWPLGIHHPDHLLVAEAECGPGVYRTYEELPYRVLYPPQDELTMLHVGVRRVGYDPSNLFKKKELCRMYASQVDDQLERSLYVPERLWGRS